MIAKTRGLKGRGLTRVSGLTIILAATTLSACVTSTSPDTPMVVEIDEIIAEAAERSSRANVAVSEVEVAVAAPTRPGPGQTLPSGVSLPPEATQLVDIDWQGPVEPMLTALADRVGYTFRVIGHPPASPVMVSIIRDQVPLVDIVRETGTMVHDHADVVFNPTLRVIELRYEA